MRLAVGQALSLLRTSGQTEATKLARALFRRSVRVDLLCSRCNLAGPSHTLAAKLVYDGPPFRPDLRSALHLIPDFSSKPVAAGALGSLVHCLTSFADFVGNRNLRQSWVWFLILRTPIGFALALLFYPVLRGGS